MAVDGAEAEECGGGGPAGQEADAREYCVINFYHLSDIQQPFKVQQTRWAARWPQECTHSGLLLPVKCLEVPAALRCAAGSVARTEQVHR
jgi:hypothetical protein